eukprot:TRINITY_DN22959_c0_g1_i3.p3 TRINITY_DN22959_c0_g1~~TRINITY_DN22959_c0_g1_i3.p3  ORF type:complete len:100 (+),score=20.03 TRINITY_DN22959_c0_g1_i3:413-712(+)
MTTLDELWTYYSGGRFGYSAQRRVWQQCSEHFDSFAQQTGWFKDEFTNRNWPDEFIYRLDAPEGHLPLTNCIRGAKVLQEIMNHAAFRAEVSGASTSVT